MNYPSTGFVWCFLIIRLRLGITSRIPQRWGTLSVHHIRGHWMAMCITSDANLQHFPKVASVRIFSRSGFSSSFPFPSWNKWVFMNVLRPEYVLPFSPKIKAFCFTWEIKENNLGEFPASPCDRSSSSPCLQYNKPFFGLFWSFPLVPAEVHGEGGSKRGPTSPIYSCWGGGVTVSLPPQPTLSLHQFVSWCRRGNPSSQCPDVSTPNGHVSAFLLSLQALSLLRFGAGWFLCDLSSPMVPKTIMNMEFDRSPKSSYMHALCKVEVIWHNWHPLFFLRFWNQKAKEKTMFLNASMCYLPLSLFLGALWALEEK